MGGVVDAISDVVDSVTDVVSDVVEGVVDVVEDVVDGVGDFVSDIGETALDVVTSPVGQIAMYAIPGLNAYAPYINAAAKVANGQDLSLTDIAALGLKGYSDLNAGVKVDPNVVKATRTAAAIGDGGDPASVLLANYGSDFVKELNIDTEFKAGLENVLDDETMSFVQDNIDFNRVANDMIAGRNPTEMMVNQFGNTVVNNLAADDPDMKALGYAGLKSAVALSNGASPESALLAGGKEYYKQGGDLPDLGNIASNIDLGNWGIDVGDIDFDMTGLDFLADIGKDIYSGIKEFGLPDINLKLGIDTSGMGDIDWGQFKLADFGGDFNLPELQGFGVNINQLQDAGKLPVAFALAELEDQQRGVQSAADSEDTMDFFKTDSFKNDLLADEALPLSRKLLGTTYA